MSIGHGRFRFCQLFCEWVVVILNGGYNADMCAIVINICVPKMVSSWAPEKGNVEYLLREKMPRHELMIPSHKKIMATSVIHT